MDTEEKEEIDEEKLEKFLATVDWEKVDRRDRMKSEFKWRMNINQTRKRSKEILDFFEDDDIPFGYKLDVVNGKLERSEKILKRMVNTFPESDEIHVFYIFVLKELDKMDDLFSEFERALESMPENPGILNNYALELSETGRYEEAEIKFKRAIEMSPDISIPYTNLGSMYREMDRFSESLDMFEMAIKIEPGDEYNSNQIMELKKLLNDRKIQ